MTAGPARQPGLVTAGQRRVLQLIAEGYTKAEVGALLFISEDTVRSQMRMAFARMGARNRCHAVALLMAAGEIGLPNAEKRPA